MGLGLIQTNRSDKWVQPRSCNSNNSSNKSDDIHGIPGKQGTWTPCVDALRSTIYKVSEPDAWMLSITLQFK